MDVLVEVVAIDTFIWFVGGFEDFLVDPIRNEFLLNKNHFLLSVITIDYNKHTHTINYNTQNESDLRIRLTNPTKLHIKFRGENNIRTKIGFQKS